MDARHLLRCLLPTLSAAVLGCVSPDPSVDLLEGELRWMEDQLYMLEDELQLKCTQLTACRQGSASAKDCNCKEPTPAQPWRVPNLDSGSGAETLPRPKPRAAEIIRSPAEPSQAGSKPDEPEEAPEELDGFDLGAPEIELPEPEAIRGERPELEAPTIPPPAAFEAPSDTESSHDSNDGPPNFQTAPLLLGEAVDRVELNAKRVSTHNKLHGQDEEKLLVVVEPRSKQDVYIELSAPLTVSIEGADEEGLSSLGRWEFNAVETGRTLRESNMGRGIHLALDWPPDLPLDDRLRVLVTYTTLDGTQLVAEKLLEPKSETATVAGWTPVAKTRQEQVLAQPADDPFMLAEQTPPQSGETFFKTVPIPAEPGPASQTVQASLFADDAGNVVPQRADAARSARAEIEESLDGEPHAPSPIPVAREGEQVARPMWHPYR